MRQPRGRSSSSKKRRTADSDIFCPIITALSLRGGRITRSTRLAELGEVTVMKDTGRWRDVGSEEPVSGRGGDRQKSN